MKVFRGQKAQAVLELALFGVILIMLLGALLSYGLRYSLEQKTMMSAFRKALKASDNPDLGGQASYTLLQDKHIPNPSNPFAVGSVMPFMSSASVIRSYRLHETADTYAELPETKIKIQTQEFTYKTADFRPESILCASLDKYKEIYGDTNIVGGDSCVCTPGYDAYGNRIDECPGGANISIIDSCEGELISYDACKRQCRMITQVDYCVRECERGKLPGSDKNCSEICNQQIQTPWYCDKLDNIFDFAIAKNKPKAMGVQPEYTKQTVMSNSLRKQESGGVITTTDTINWSDITNRTLVYIDREKKVQEVPVTTTVGETATLNCRDGVCQ